MAVSQKCEANAKQCRVISAPAAMLTLVWVFSDMRLSCWPQHFLPYGLLAAASAAEADQEQRLPGVPRGQDADQDQRRRQRGLPVRGCGQARRLRPQDQHLRELPRRHHRQAPRRQRPGAAGQLQARATRSNPRATAPASTAWPWPRGGRTPRRAATVTTGTPSCRPPRRLRRCISPGWPRRAARATTRRPRTWRKACMARPWPPATARRPPAPIAIRSTRSKRSRAVRP